MPPIHFSPAHARYLSSGFFHRRAIRLPGITILLFLAQAPCRANMPPRVEFLAMPFQATSDARQKISHLRASSRHFRDAFIECHFPLL